jgi:6-pyruvoyltetrahydropterin/6-carboxytetrahydropterin synthase
MPDMTIAPASGRQSAGAIFAAGGIYRVTKTYDHNEGLSCSFRQWRATHSHCRFLHGYALAFKFTVATRELDARNWCFDFGAFKPLRAWLHEMFDHTTLIAEDDPERERLLHLEQAGLMQVRILPAVGCEATAHFVFEHAARFITEETQGRAWLESVEVREHGGNSVTYAGSAG